MSVAEIIGIVLGAISIVLLLATLYLLQRVYVVTRRDKRTGEE